MKLKQVRVFISYARKDQDKVKELYQQLKEAGFSPWQDIHDILPGELWRDALMRAIREAPFFLACLSTNSVNKRGVIQEELKEALQSWRQKLDDDIYLIPVRLEECPVPEALSEFQWVDIYSDGGHEKLHKALRVGMKKTGIVTPLQLRVQPINDLSEDDVKDMLMKYDFPDQRVYSKGKGIHHLYEPKGINDHQVVIDRTTGLMWQQSNSSKKMHFKEAPDYIAKLNLKKFAGFDDWRLPTLEELMSLMEPAKIENGRYIDSFFDQKESWIWSADQLQQASEAWYVVFLYGYCMHSDVSKPKVVRAVRSTQSD